jgi:hypothetical protein
MSWITDPTVLPYGPAGYAPKPASPPLLLAPPSPPLLVLPLLLPDDEDPDDDPDEEPDEEPDDVELPLLLPLLDPLELLPLLLPLPPLLDPLLLVPPELPVSPPPEDPDPPEHATRSAATAPKPVHTAVVFTITFPFVARQAT